MKLKIIKEFDRVVEGTAGYTYYQGKEIVHILSYNHKLSDIFDVLRITPVVFTLPDYDDVVYFESLLSPFVPFRFCISIKGDELRLLMNLYGNDMDEIKKPYKFSEHFSFTVKTGYIYYKREDSYIAYCDGYVKYRYFKGIGIPKVMRVVKRYFRLIQEDLKLLRKLGF
ncbi:MAG: hypothetical protein RMI01_09195 [Thermodesulfovibrio sp.]|nr:hypothetical protein [Thermodesulfovibrio sp.]